MVAWQNPEVRALYDGGANSQVFAYERLIPFQVLRALLWVLFALPVIRMTRGTRWQIAAIPFGGYVKFLGDADATSSRRGGLNGP